MLWCAVQSQFHPPLQNGRAGAQCAEVRLLLSPALVIPELTIWVGPELGRSRTGRFRVARAPFPPFVQDLVERTAPTPFWTSGSCGHDLGLEQWWHDGLVEACGCCCGSGRLGLARSNSSRGLRHDLRLPLLAAFLVAHHECGPARWNCSYPCHFRAPRSRQSAFMVRGSRWSGTCRLGHGGDPRLVRSTSNRVSRAPALF